MWLCCPSLGQTNFAVWHHVFISHCISKATIEKLMRQSVTSLLWSFSICWATTFFCLNVTVHVIQCCRWTIQYIATAPNWFKLNSLLNVTGATASHKRLHLLKKQMTLWHSEVGTLTYVAWKLDDLNWSWLENNKKEKVAKPHKLRLCILTYPLNRDKQERKKEHKPRKKTSGHIEDTAFSPSHKLSIYEKAPFLNIQMLTTYSSKFLL